MLLSQLLLTAAFFAAQAAAPSLEKISIPSAGGVVSATYRDAGAGSPGVLLFPMCDPKAIDGWGPVAELLRNAGVSSLLVVYPGYGGTRRGASFYDEPAHADAALAWLRSRIGNASAVGVAGSSCGVHFALGTAQRHPKIVRAAVAFAGPHTGSHVEFIRKTPELAVLSGSAEGNTPAPDWARILKEASRHPASRLLLPGGKAHGTDVFPEQPEVAADIARWLAARLR